MAQIENEFELSVTLEALGKVSRNRASTAKETAYPDELRQMLVEDADAMHRKLEREIVEYLARKHGYVKVGAESVPAIPDAPRNGSHTNGASGHEPAAPVEAPARELVAA